MDVLREREVKDSLERQLQDEQKVRGEYRARARTVILPRRKSREVKKRRREEVCLYEAPNPREDVRVHSEFLQVAS